MPQIRALAARAATVHVLFNNNYRDYGVRNARQMTGLLGLADGRTGGTSTSASDPTAPGDAAASPPARRRSCRHAAGRRRPKPDIIVTAGGGDGRTTMQVPGLARDERRALERETVALLCRLLQADTTNPPGNETRAALVLREYFAGHGLEPQLVGDLPDRQNLIVRLPGARPGPRLGLLGHLDVVPAEADEWTRPAVLRGGARRLRLGPRRDRHEEPGGRPGGRRRASGARRRAVCRRAVFIATADEERGDYCGARWLVTQRPELVRCDYLLNEGGGTYSVVDGVRLYPLTVGEKAFADFRITVRGRGGHGSVPLHDLNPVERLGRVITALADHEAGVTVAPFTARYIDRLVADPGLRARLKDPALARAAVRELHAHRSRSRPT